MNSLRDISDAVRSRRRSARDVIGDSLDRLRSREPSLHAFLRVFAEEALADARTIDDRISRGDGANLPLAGVPIALKDNICLSRGRTTCASRFLEHYESPFTATAAQRLIDAGAIVIGKTNLDEFAMGSSTEHSAFGPTRHPLDPTRVPGGSSGGSAASVAAGIVPLSLGSDTGGSIRQPAGFCGVVGVKPTYGRVSRYGLVAFASSLDQIGTFTNSVVDAADALQVLIAHDPLDSTSSDHRVPDFRKHLHDPIEQLTLGIPRQTRLENNHAGAAAVFEQTVRRFAQSGASIVEIDLSLIDAAIAAYYIVSSAEASSNLARFDGVRYGRRAEPRPGEGLFDLYARSRAEGFGPEVKRRIMLGTHVLSSGYYDAYYNSALKVRRKLLGQYTEAFRSGCHAILMPVSPGPAFKLGEKTSDPLAMYLEDVYTVGVNLAGLPACSVPAGTVRESGIDLPIGVQVIAPPFDEATMLRVAALIEDG